MCACFIFLWILHFYIYGKMSSFEKEKQSSVDSRPAVIMLILSGFSEDELTSKKRIVLWFLLGLLCLLFGAYFYYLIVYQKEYASLIQYGSYILWILFVLFVLSLVGTSTTSDPSVEHSRLKRKLQTVWYGTFVEYYQEIEQNKQNSTIDIFKDKKRQKNSCNTKLSTMKWIIKNNLTQEALTIIAQSAADCANNAKTLLKSYNNQHPL